MSNLIFVLYHANCPDGFAAAWAAWMSLKGTAEYLPVTYGDALPEMPEGSQVFIVDFSFPREVLLGLHERCEVRVIDHHATAQEALKGLHFAQFDMTKSGAVLTWEYFHPNVPVPEMLLFVQDRDLWQWKLPHSEAINAGLWRGTPRDFAVWMDLEYLWDRGVTTAKERLQAAGEAIAFSDKLMVRNLCRAPVWLRVLNYTVPAVNSPVLQSEIGHQLLCDYPCSPFAAVWWILEDGQPTFSLRSRKEGVDVSVIAKEFGGGGHKAAAGFRPRKMFEILEAHKEAQKKKEGQPSGAERIAAERQRQLLVEGWKPWDDDKYVHGELRDAGIAYAMACDDRAASGAEGVWPWNKTFWKPSEDPIRNLEKGGALFAAEIDRLLRKKGGQP